MFKENTYQVSIGGSELSFLDVGSGLPVILTPSYLWGAEMWKPQLEALARRFRVIVPVMWGHGDSGRLPTGTKDLKDLALQHLELLDQLSIETCALVGLSLGGMWGAELALIAPDRVSSLVLMGTSLAAEPEASRTQYFTLLDIIEDAGAVPSAIRQAITPLFFSQSVSEHHPGLLQEFDAQLAAWSPQRLRDSVTPLGRIIFGRRDAMDDLAQLAMPVLVMTGENDIARPTSEGHAMAARIGCPFTSIPRAGHISSLEAPAFVNEALAKFLNL